MPTGAGVGDVTRRSLIQRVLLLLGIDPIGLIGCASRRIASETSRPVEGALDPSSEGGPLSTAEVEDLVAFGEVLVEGRTLAPTERQYLLAHIEGSTGRSSDYLALYRGTASMLARLAGRRFSSLEVRERVELIGCHRLAASVGAEENLGPFPAEMRALRMRAAPDLIRGYYGSPAGWAVVGYDSFPGRCGDLTRYTRPES